MNEASFWVRVHDLPLMTLDEYVGREVGSTVGIVEEVDLNYGEVE